jgi:hypothetical protein
MHWGGGVQKEETVDLSSTGQEQGCLVVCTKCAMTSAREGELNEDLKRVERGSRSRKVASSFSKGTIIGPFSLRDMI